jgi:DcuC family C4-dicarboxylate transporter
MYAIAASLVVVVIGGVMLARRVDVRLVLFLCAAALFAIRAFQPNLPPGTTPFNEFARLFIEYAKGLTLASAVVPICSAMGFAYVCKLTGCDAHLVHLLVAPLRYVRPLLIPGGIAVSFFVNSAIVSQTSTVSVVGPVLIPLLVGAGISLETAGALLLLGGSMGGELLNPAAVEVAAIKGVTGQDSLTIIRRLLPYNLVGSGTALLVFWMLAWLRERRSMASSPDRGIPIVGLPDFKADVETPFNPQGVPRQEDEQSASIVAAMPLAATTRIDRVNVFKAMVPLVPIFLLVVVRRLIPMPEVLTSSEKNPIAEQATIGAAMLIGVFVAGLTSPGKVTQLAAAFFDGAGFAFTHVISVIAAAQMFAAGVSANGLIEAATRGLKDAPTLVTVASVVIPWAMAMVTGTAVGTAPLVINILLPIAMGGASSKEAATSVGLRAGALNAVAAQFGRTSSPVAPVVIMCGALSRTRPLDLVKRVLPPLIIGGIVMLIAAMLRLF